MIEIVCEKDTDFFLVNDDEDVEFEDDVSFRLNELVKFSDAASKREHGMRLNGDAASESGNPVDISDKDASQF